MDWGRLTLRKLRSDEAFQVSITFSFQPKRALTDRSFRLRDQRHLLIDLALDAIQHLADCHFVESLVIDFDPLRKLGLAVKPSNQLRISIIAKRSP